AIDARAYNGTDATFGVDARPHRGWNDLRRCGGVRGVAEVDASSSTSQAIGAHTPSAQPPGEVSNGWGLSATIEAMLFRRYG
ncbi:MAG: hypothetical protein IPK99_11075, partial [Flavobacteriales bacterium]|nr:hypothetical protein [Flavobacteriales bacterium]